MALKEEKLTTFDPRHAERLQRRLHWGGILGILLTSILVGSLSAVLLYKAHTDNLSQQLLFNTELVSAALDSEVSRIKNTVVQITSRTRIRQELERYNNREISLEQLISFSRPKLQDVLNLTPDIIGINRLGPNGKGLIQVGQTIPEQHWPEGHVGDSPAIGSVFTRDKQQYLVASAPIRNRKQEIVGTDIALFGTSRLKSVINSFFDRHDGTGRVQINKLHTEGLQAFLVHGDVATRIEPQMLLQQTQQALQNPQGSSPIVSKERQRILASQHIKDTDWVLNFASDLEEFHAPAASQAVYVLLAFLCLTFLGIWITRLIINPATGRILVGTQTLHKLLEDNQTLLTGIKDSEAQLQAIVDNAPSIIYVKNLDGSYRLANTAYENFSGLGRDDITGKTDFDLFPEEIARRLSEHDRQVLKVGHAITSDEQAPHADGLRDYLSIKFPLKNDSGETYGICGIATDISERKQNERQLKQLATVFESSGEAIMVTNAQGRIIDINPAFTRIMGFASDQVIGENPRLLKSGKQDKQFYELMWQSLLERDFWRGEIWNKRRDGSLIPTLASITAIRDEQHEPINFVAVYSDISALKKSEERLGHLAHHDPLTDLPNRVLLDVRMEHAIARARRFGKKLGVIFLDLDNFKNVNDSLGHKAGDDLLKEIARLLRTIMRSDDTVARISGDEFVLLIEDIEHSEAIIQIIEKVLHAFDRQFSISGQSIRVTASLGVSLFPDDGEDNSILMRNADAAMYLAKSEGRNTYNFYTKELTQKAFERMQVETWLREALKNEELSLHYQPQINLQSGRLEGLEALLRWTRPDGTQITPDRFIPIAEASDLMIPLGHWILLQACTQARTWLDQGLEFGRMAINISGKQISGGNLVDTLDRVLQETRVPPSVLELELTESFVMGDTEEAIPTLQQLRERQVTLTIDDFGTGYSSLAYLKSLPIHRLKIDRSFVRDIPDDNNDMAITQAVIALGKSLQLEIVGEGIETRQQLAFLHQAGCNLGQGYLFSRPLPPEKLNSLLQRQNWIEELSVKDGVDESH